MDNITVVELRRHALRPGARTQFSRYFDTWLPEAFQQLGAAALGQFHILLPELLQQGLQFRDPLLDFLFHQ